jgi:hypothetical protein
MEKLFAPDKRKHFYYGMLIALATIILFLPFPFSIPVLGTISAGIVGIGKEVIYDKKMGKGQFEWLDFVATMNGGIVIDGILFIIF